MSRLIICTNYRPFAREPSCAFRGSKLLANFLEQDIKERSLAIRLKRSVWLGHCPIGPNVRIAVGEFIHHASEEKLQTLLDQPQGQEQE
jgi:NADH:ubiquinone oxidoreductase subunit E